MHKFTIGGVPEYFNLPILNAIATGDLEKADIKLRWETVKEGTGAMSKMLHDGDLDIAMILLEGATKSILEGQRIKIIKDYVSSPLTWGVHTSPFVHSVDELYARRIGISRYGSGSHMMAFLMAEQYGWPKESLEFVVINNLDGALDAFAKQEIDIFLWEKFTTKPFVDAGQMNRIDTVATPWPCFVLAANARTMAAYSKEVKKICQLINHQASVLMSDKSLSELISKDYGLTSDDSKLITQEVKWSTATEVDEMAIQKVMDTYRELKVIKSTQDTKSLIALV